MTRPSEDERRFWGDMPDYRRFLRRVGWPEARPRHAWSHEGWQRQVLLSVALCVGVVLILLLFPTGQPRVSHLHHPARHLVSTTGTSVRSG